MVDPNVTAEARGYIHEWMEARLTPGVQERYARARRMFAAWCNEVGVECAALKNEEIDVFVARFILHVKEDDDSLLTRQSCLDLMATAQRRACAKLRLSQQVLRLWHREEPPRQAEAMPASVAYALVTVLSLVLQRREAALHVLLAFSACLRIGESLSLRRCNVVLPRSQSNEQCVLILRATKRGFDQRVVLGNSAVVATVRSFLDTTSYADGMAQLAPCTYAQFARAFNLGVRLLQLPGSSWRSHSLRRGGATSLMELGWAFSDVKLYGRWASESSAREYIRLGQSAVARLHNSMAPEMWRRCEILASGCCEAFKLDS